MTHCKICNNEIFMTCICGYCFNCIKRFTHEECVKMDEFHTDKLKQENKWGTAISEDELFGKQENKSNDFQTAKQCLNFQDMKCNNKQCLNECCPLNKVYDKENKSNLCNTHTPKSSIIIRKDITKGCGKKNSVGMSCGSYDSLGILLCEDCRNQDLSAPDKKSELKEGKNDNR